KVQLLPHTADYLRVLIQDVVKGRGTAFHRSDDDGVSFESHLQATLSSFANSFQRDRDSWPAGVLAQGPRSATVAASGRGGTTSLAVHLNQPRYVVEFLRDVGIVRVTPKPFLHLPLVDRVVQVIFAATFLPLVGHRDDDGLADRQQLPGKGGGIRYVLEYLEARHEVV